MFPNNIIYCCEKFKLDVQTEELSGGASHEPLESKRGRRYCFNLKGEINTTKKKKKKSEIVSSKKRCEQSSAIV